MATDLQTSFIPKQTAPLPPIERRGKPINFLMLVSAVIFVAGLAASGWVFGYELYLQKTNNVLADELTRLKPDKGVIDELKQFNQRVDTASKLLTSHTTLSPLFTLLEKTTLQNVRFKSMTYQHSPDTRSMTIQLAGEAKNYEAVALQSDAFGASGGIKNAVFSGLGFNRETRTINFSVNAIVDPHMLAYSKNFQSDSASSGASPSVSDAAADAMQTASSTSTGS